jgi:hypothetical protein
MFVSGKLFQLILIRAYLSPFDTFMLRHCRDTNSGCMFWGEENWTQAIKCAWDQAIY